MAVGMDAAHDARTALCLASSDVRAGIGIEMIGGNDAAHDATATLIGGNDAGGAAIAIGSKHTDGPEIPLPSLPPSILKVTLAAFCPTVVLVCQRSQIVNPVPTQLFLG